MRSTRTLLSDVSERSEESSSCSTSEITSQHTNFNPGFEVEEPRRVPCIDIEPIDETPFSESFSGMLDNGDFNTTSFRLTNDTSYNLDVIVNLEVDSDWDDDDVDEIIVISRKSEVTKPAAQRSYPAKSIAINTLDRKKLLDNVFSLSEFDFIDNMVDFRETTYGTHAIRKCDTNRVYIMKAFPATPSLKWPLELRLLEMLTEQACSFLPCILRRIFEHQTLFILLESYPAGSMLEYVLQEGALDPDEVLFYSSEIAEAISVLHDASIEHCKINPANVMIGDDGHLVLTNFEIARVDGIKIKSSGVDQNQNQTLRDDCWGLGCLIYFMTYGKHPFPLIAFDQVQVYKQVLRGGSSTVYNDGRMESSALDLMLKCLERNPRLRPDIEAIKQHEYFISITWSIIRQKGIIAPYIPNSPNPVGAPQHDVQSPREEIDTAFVQTLSNWELLNSAISKTFISSPQARNSVQDLLPTIFRSPSLDELKMKSNQSRLAEDHSASPQKSFMNRMSSYESLQRSPIVNKLTQEERLSLFWELLDKDINADPPKPARVLGIPVSCSESQIQEPLSHVSRLRRQRSSIITQTNNRLSQLMATRNKLRKLRRPKSTPAFTHPDVIMKSGSKIDEYELPNGIKQIGSGIGFTYTVPAAARSKSSICTPTSVPRRSHSILPSIGVGIGLGLRNFGGGILRTRLRQEGHVDPEIGHQNQDHYTQIYNPQNTGMNSVHEDVTAEVDAEQQDVFRYGSTWSLLPSEGCKCTTLSPCLDQISPITATDSTVYSPMSNF
ncbi:kinase-like domain-containing protein [Lentinula aff. lateritia]|uniref:Kinase-like domain-containing protein n=1 Tax=Lentinula aff. lateritia TaxID=2804960 RepID=A0ACC1TJH4_9AGAR|nr:kinase-like domain-containing protein [Lentinula aff. lateritia]